MPKSTACSLPAACKAATPQPARVLSSDALLRGSREVHIVHRGKLYRLIETRGGKLLLNV